LNKPNNFRLESSNHSHGDAREKAGGLSIMQALSAIGQGCENRKNLKGYSCLNQPLQGGYGD
jgi:hypothetical protein